MKSNFGIRGSAASGPILAQPAVSCRIRKPAARIRAEPIPSNSACGSTLAIASARATAVSSPEASPVEKKYRILLEQNALLRFALEKFDDVPARIGSRLRFHG